MITIAFEWVSIIVILLSILVLLVFSTVLLLSGIISRIYGAPYVPMKKSAVKSLLVLAEPSEKDVFYDLGSGDGRVLESVVENFRVRRVIGYESAFWPYWESKFSLWQSKLGDTIKIYRQNFFKADLSDATLIYMYLFPKLINRLALKIANECRSGTKVLCPGFPIDINANPEFKLLKSEKINKITAYLYEKV